MVPGTLLVGPAQCKPEFWVISIDLKFDFANSDGNNKLNETTEEPKRFIPSRQCLFCSGLKCCKRETGGRV